MVELKKILDDLNIPKEYFKDIEIDWELSSQSIPDNIMFLEKTEYMRCYKMIQVASDIEAQLDTTIELIKSSSSLKALFWHAHCKLAIYENHRFEKWPEMFPLLGENSSIFYLLVALSQIDVWSYRFQKKGILEEYAIAAAAWIGGTVQVYRSGHDNKPGINKQQLYWIRHYIDCELFRCGRFEYMNQQMPEWCPSVFRRKKDGLTIALASSQRELNSDGFTLYNDEDLKDAALITTLTKTKSYVEGTPISPSGTALVKTLVRLPLEEWTQMLGPGDFTPGIHIPAGGGMSPESCKDSFLKAEEFYKKYFPTTPVKAFICASWIFSPDYERMLPNSNLAKFMREIYLFPVNSSGKDGMFFLFGQEPDKHKNLPRDNSVRRAMLTLLDEGKRLRNGGMLFLPSDIDEFGNQYYLNQFKIPDNIVVYPKE